MYSKLSDAELQTRVDRAQAVIEALGHMEMEVKTMRKGMAGSLCRAIASEILRQMAALMAAKGRSRALMENEVRRRAASRRGK
jgi:hypothetical protein